MPAGRKKIRSIPFQFVGQQILPRRFAKFVASQNFECPKFRTLDKGGFHS